MATADDLARRAARLAEVERLQVEWLRVEAEREALMDRRAAAIAAALDAGCAIKDVAGAAQIGDRRVLQIRRDRSRP